MIYVTGDRVPETVKPILTNCKYVFLPKQEKSII
jgi:hypothetical protein